MTDYMQAAVEGLHRWTPSPHEHEGNAVALGLLSDISRQEIAESVMNSVLDAQREALGIKGWFIAKRGDGEPTVWKPNPGYQNSPRAVTTESLAAPDVWAILSALIPERTAEEAVLTCAWGGCRREYDPNEEADCDEIFCSKECRRAEADDNEKTAMAAEHDPHEDIEEPS